MKRKILACVLACLTLFLGFGYAGWTDSLQIDGTVDTGELNVKFIDVRAFASMAEFPSEEFNDGWVVFTGIPGNQSFAANYFDDTNYNQFADPNGIAAFENAIADYTQTKSDIAQAPNNETLGSGHDDNYLANALVSDSIQIELNKLYPGYAQLFKTDIINTGTLAAKLADIDVTLTGEGDPEPELLDMIGVALDVYDESDQRIVNVLSGLTEGEDFFKFKGVKFIRLSALQDIDPANLGDLLLIYPNDANTMDVVFGVAMDPDWTGVYTTGQVTDNGVVSPLNVEKDIASQLGATGFNIKFKWDQMNAPKLQEEGNGGTGVTPDPEV